jgi:amino acid adenylation domain-containing protein
VVFLPALPQTASAKIDRRALPELHRARITSSRQGYASDVERQLAVIWERLLCTSAPPRDVSFFNLGGHSLLATQLATEIERVFHSQVAIPELFDCPTIERLAARIEQKAPVGQGRPAMGKASGRIHPLSAAQRRLYVLRKIDETGTAYNCLAAWRVRGGLRYSRALAALRTLVERHEVLRTVFVESEGTVAQQVLDQIEPPVEFFRIKDEGEVDRLLTSFVRPFELSAPPLFRIGVIRISGRHHVIAFDFHHIVADDATIELFKREFSELYQGRSLPSPRLQYADYVAWERTMYADGQRQRDLAYWDRQLGRPLPALELPLDGPRPSRQSFAGGVLHADVDRTLWAKLAALAGDNDASPFMVLLSALSVLLHRYGGQDDVLVGTAAAGRQHPETQEIAGVFVNTLVMRSRPVASKTFRQLLTEARVAVMEGLEHQFCEFDALVRQLAVERTSGRGPLFDVLLVMHSLEAATWHLRDCHTCSLPTPGSNARADLVLDIFPSCGGGADLRLEYETRLFARDTAERVLQHYLAILRYVADHPEAPLGDIPILTETELALVRRFNQTNSDYARDATVHQIFSTRARGNPEKIALVCAGRSLTFGQLDRASSRLGARLRELGIGRDDVVGVLLPRSLETLVAIYGVLKSGGGYLPLDLDLPAARAEQMLKAAGAKALVTSRLLTRPGFDGRLLFLDEIQDEGTVPPDPVTLNAATALAYVLFTSGSTGTPKGVMIQHRSVVNFIHGITQNIAFGADDVIVSATTVSFDIFGLETLLALSQGTRVVLATDEQRRDPRALAALIHDSGATVFQSTPSRFKLLLADQRERNAIRSLRCILLGGEALPEAMLADLQQLTQARIFNLYGPTETTIWSTLAEVTRSGRPTIGAPIANTRVHVVDACGAVAPIGVVGELCIAGDGVARGYINDPARTAQCFVPEVGNPEARMYRTGDLARWRADGHLEFLGRRDNQVKVRGHRIELGEIQCAMKQIDGVRDAVVWVQGDADMGFLVGYYLADTIIKPESWRTALGQWLPAYMVPSYFVRLERVPLSPNGKLDVRALPVPEAEPTTEGPAHAVAAAETVQARLLGMWRTVLGREDVGLHENFFEAGGDSFLLTRLHGLIDGEYRGAMNLGDVFALPTIARQAAWVKERLAKTGASAPKGMLLPADFHATAGAAESSRFQQITLRLDNPVHRALARLEAQRPGGSFDTILSALVLYLGRLCGPTVLVHVAWNGKERDIAAMRLDCSRLRTMGELRDQIAVARAGGAGQAGEWAAGDKPRETPILFGRNRSMGDPTTHGFALSFAPVERHDGATIVCSLDGTRLREETLSRFMAGYAKVIAAVLDNKSTEN